MGAVFPILILNNLTEPLGAPTAYVLAALVPVGWVFTDLFFITRRFNFITSYIGVTALANGLLAFWFVDGILFAFKDSAAAIVSFLVFGGSLLIGRPAMQFFATQALNPDTREREDALRRLWREPPVYRALYAGTWIVLVENVLTGILNFFLNYTIVVAPFGSLEFNQQVAQVNAITRVVMPIVSMVAVGAAIWLVYRALYRQLPREEGRPQLESDFWDLVQLRESGGATG